MPADPVDGAHLFILEMIGPGNAAERQRRYRAHVEEALRQGLPDTPWENVRGQIALGSTKFFRKIRETISANRREQPSLRRMVDRPGWASVVALVERIKGEPWEQFANRHGDWGRDLAFYLGRKRCQMKLAELGTHAGAMDYASVGMALRRFEHQLTRDKNLARKVEKALNQLL